MPGADYRIAWRPKALEDLRSIVRYITQDSPTRARAFGKKLRDKVQPLAQHPLLGHEGRPGLPAGVRELVMHANYIAFYRVIDSSRTVEILRVKHVAQQGVVVLFVHVWTRRPLQALRGDGKWSARMYPARLMGTAFSCPQPR